MIDLLYDKTSFLKGFVMLRNACLGRHATSRRPGFTLIELLLVISIIALLISMLLPALSKARASARSVQCLSQERQVMLAIIMYANDSDGMTMPTSVENRTLKKEKYWPWILSGQGYIPQNDAINSNRLTSEVWYCPDAFPSSYEESVPLGNWSYIYGMRIWKDPNRAWSGSAFGSYRKLDSIRNPSTFWYLGDSIHLSASWAFYNIHYGANAENQRAHLRHHGAANMMFADGHGGGVDKKFIEETHIREPDYTNTGSYYRAWPD